MLLLSSDPYLGIFIFFLAVALGPPLILVIVGLFLLRKNAKASKVLFIIAGLYVLVGAGFCGLLTS